MALHFRVPRNIGEKRISQILSRLMKKAGIISPVDPYKVKVHSLRKFFKTQLLALGVQPDYVNCMMGHTIDTYHDVQSKGIEFLRGIYTAANLTLEPRQKLTKLDQLKIFA
jgi:site-specific recombinase XerD